MTIYFGGRFDWISREHFGEGLCKVYTAAEDLQNSEDKRLRPLAAFLSSDQASRSVDLRFIAIDPSKECHMISDVPSEPLSELIL